MCEVHLAPKVISSLSITDEAFSILWWDLLLLTFCVVLCRLECNCRDDDDLCMGVCLGVLC